MTASYTGAYTGYVRRGGAVTYVLIRALAAPPTVARLYTRLRRLGFVGGTRHTIFLVISTKRRSRALVPLTAAACHFDRSER